jgi:hypothetical protein
LEIISNMTISLLHSAQRRLSLTLVVIPCSLTFLSNDIDDEPYAERSLYFFKVVFLEMRISE